MTCCNLTRSAVLLALLTGASTEALAQRTTASLELGGSQMRYADSINARAASITPSLTFEWPRATIDATFSRSNIGSQSWASQGRFSASAWMPIAGPFTAGADAWGGGSAHDGGPRTSQVIGTARLYAMASSGGAWVGGGLGRVSDGRLASGVRLGEVGLWIGGRSRMASVSFTPTMLGDSIRYRDLQGYLQLSAARYEASLSLGTRSGSTAVSTLGGANAKWGSAEVLAWLSPGIGLTVSGGTYPVDLMQGFPGGRFAAAGFRLRWQSATNEPAPVRTKPETRPVVLPPVAPVTRVVEPIVDFKAENVVGQKRLLRVRAPNARAVEVSASFTDWKPIALTSAGNGWWTLERDLAPGVHRLNIRVDSGAWLVPPGLAKLADDLGGTVGLLIINPDGR